VRNTASIGIRLPNRPEPVASRYTDAHVLLQNGAISFKCLFHKLEGIKIEEVNSAKYLGTIMNADNLIEEEIKERIAAGN